MSGGVETVICDNGQGDEDHDEDATVETTVIGGGSIVIHKARGTVVFC